MNKMSKKAKGKMMPNSLPEGSDNPEGQKISLEKLLRIIDYTQDIEVSCDDVEQILDQFAELAQRGEDVKQMMPLIQNHVDMCPECREEFEALMRVLQHTG
jgi:hypothetical protein